MKNNELIKSQGRIYRILDVSGQEILVIDCLKLTMPLWIEASDVQSAEMITDEELCQITDYHFPDFNQLSPEDKSIAHRRFTMISEIIPVVGDKNERSNAIRRVSEHNSISKVQRRRQ